MCDPIDVHFGCAAYCGDETAFLSFLQIHHAAVRVPEHFHCQGTGTALIPTDSSPGVTSSWESLTYSGVDRRLPFSSFIYVGIYVGSSAGDIDGQIAVMECFGIQNFPFLRACLKGR